MELLTKYLAEQNMFTGPPDLANDYISNSGLSEIKRVLLSEPPFLGDEIHLIFGNEAHKRNLENKKTRKMSPEHEDWLKGMKKVFINNSFVQQAIKGSIIETKSIDIVEGIRFMSVLDIDNVKKKTVFDYKTTSVSTEKQFIDLAIKKYDYLRQGLCYKWAKHYPDCIFIGQQKKEPYSIFIFNTKDYAKEERKAAKETKFLIEFYKHHGRAIFKGTQVGKS